MTESTKHLIRSHELKDSEALRVRHPLNANAEVTIHFLEKMTGLQRIALRIARVPPGRESFAYHSHSLHEEFVYILSGRGTAEIGE